MKRLFTKKRLFSFGLALLLIVVLLGAGFLLIPRPTTKWSFQAERYFSSVSSPIVSNGLVYTLLRSGDVNNNAVYALDAHSGQIKWSCSIDGFIAYAPLVANGLLYVLSDNTVDPQNTLHALDAASGREQWSYQHTALSSPAIGNGIVYTHSSDGNLFAFDARSGRQLWSASVGDGLFTTPLVANNTVYIAAEHHATKASTVFALDAASGATKWSALETTAIDQIAVANGLVYLAPENAGAQVSALDAFSGRTEWSYQLARPGGYANILFVALSFQVVNGMAYIDYERVDTGSSSVGPAMLYALDARTGQQVWSVQTVSPEPTVANGKVYNYSGNGNLSALDARSGRQQWSHQAATFNDSSLSIKPAPPVASGTVYIWTTERTHDTLHALDAVSGSEQWSYQTGGFFAVPPTVVQGVVYAALDGNGDYENVEAE